MSDVLAIRGGPRAVPEGLIQKWPPVDRSDREMVMASLAGENHAFGPNCRAFQDEFASWNGNRYAINTNSGTAALHMGIAACGCGVGDEVIVPAYSWSSSATAVLHHDAIPVFVDIDWQTMNLDIDRIEDAVTAKTRAILVVHLHGLAVDMERVLEIAARHDLKVIEDACQSHGATFRGRKVGTFGHCAAFSFNQNKSLCAGEGGMFVTDDEALYRAALSLWSFGESRTPAEDRDYHAYALGWMYRSNDLTAAFGRSQLAKLDGYLADQRRNAAHLHAALEGVPGLILPAAPAGSEHTYYNYVMRLDAAALGHAGDAVALRDRVIEAIQAEGIGRGLMAWQRFILPAMTVFQAKNAYGHGHPWSSRHAQPVDYSARRFPVAQRHCDTSFSLSAPLRTPNGREAADAAATAIRKVMTHLDQLGSA